MIGLVDAHGGILRKPTMLVASNEMLVERLRIRCNHKHRHQHCEGQIDGHTRCSQAQIWPRKMCELIVDGIQQCIRIQKVHERVQKLRYHFQNNTSDHDCQHISKDGGGTLEVREGGLYCTACSETFSHIEADTEDEPNAEPTSDIDANFTDEEDNTGTILINEAGTNIHSFPAIT